jgi:hypothetical protein
LAFGRNWWWLEALLGGKGWRQEEFYGFGREGRGEMASGEWRRVCFVPTRWWRPIVVMGGRGQENLGERGEKMKRNLACLRLRLKGLKTLLTLKSLFAKKIVVW